jgi:hypothetical protein
VNVNWTAPIGRRGSNVTGSTTKVNDGFLFPSIAEGVIANKREVEREREREKDITKKERKESKG